MEQHSPSIRARAIEMHLSGESNATVAKQLNIPYGTVGWWLHQHRKSLGIVYTRPHDCPRCLGRDFDHAAYAYLLGLYLGDGHIIAKPKNHHLSIYCGDVWPGIIRATEEAMRRVMPSAGTGHHAKTGCTEVKSYSCHWPCLFPQHGPGKKHERRIALEAWQQAIVDDFTWEFIRGLFHSDGCRITNWTVRTVAGERKRYEYPRYFFTNKSEDILGICGAALDSVGVEWKVTRRAGAAYNVSVARRGAVVLMERHIGPKS